MSKPSISASRYSTNPVGFLVICGLLLLLPLIYLPGYFTYSIWEYFVFGTACLFLVVYITRLWLLNNNLAKQLFSHVTNYALLVYLAVFLVAALFSINMKVSLWSSIRSIDGLFTYLFLTIFALAVASMVAIDGKRTALHFMKASVVGATILSILIFLSVDGLGHWFPGARGGATIGNSSLAAAYLVWNIFLGLFVILNAKTRKAKIVWGIVLLVILCSPIFLNWQGIVGRIDVPGIIGYVGAARAATLSVGIGLALSLATWLLLQGKKVKVTGLALILIIIVGLGFTIFQIGHPGSFIRKQFEDMGGRQRLIFWDISKNAIKEHPILGSGPSTFDIIFHEKFEPRMLLLPGQGETLVKNPHNLILEILINGGVLLLIASILLWLSLLYSLYIAYKSNRLSSLELALFVGAFFAWFIQDQLVYDALVSSIMLFLFIGIGYGLTIEYDSVRNGKKPFSFNPFGRNIVIGSGIAAVLLFFMAIYLPYREARTIKSIQTTNLSKRAEIYKQVGKNSPIVRGYDSVLLGNFMYNHYNAEKESFIKGDPTRRKYAGDELDSMIQYLSDLTQQNNFHPEIPYMAAKLANLQFQISPGIKNESVQRDVKLADLAVKTTPTDPRAFWVDAQIKLALKDVDGAKKLLEQAIQIEPRLPESYNLLLFIAGKGGNQDYYQNILHQAEESIPGYQPNMSNSEPAPATSI
jgi:O-antigen ligase